MVALSPAFWTRMLVFLSVIIFITAGLHIADDVIVGEPDFVPAVAIGVAAFFTLQIFATLWSWAGKLYGYIILGLIALWNFYTMFLSHALEIDRGYEALGAAEPVGWAPLFVLGSLFGGVAMAATVIIVFYLVSTAIRARRA